MAGSIPLSAFQGATGACYSGPPTTTAHVYYGFKQPGYKGALKQAQRAEGKAGAPADAAAEAASGGEVGVGAGGEAAGAVPAVVVLASSDGVRLGRDELARLGIGEGPIGAIEEGPMGAVVEGADGDEGDAGKGEAEAGAAAEEGEKAEGVVESEVEKGKEEGGDEKEEVKQGEKDAAAGSGEGEGQAAGRRGERGAEGAAQEGVRRAQVEGVRVALQVEFTLPASGYATMAIRELLKASTAAGVHKVFNDKEDGREQLAKHRDEGTPTIAVNECESVPRRVAWRVLSADFLSLETWGTKEFVDALLLMADVNAFRLWSGRGSCTHCGKVIHQGGGADASGERRGCNVQGGGADATGERRGREKMAWDGAYPFGTSGNGPSVRASGNPLPLGTSGSMAQRKKDGAEGMGVAVERRSRGGRSEGAADQRSRRDGTEETWSEGDGAEEMWSEGDGAEEMWSEGDGAEEMWSEGESPAPARKEEGAKELQNRGAGSKELRSEGEEEAKEQGAEEKERRFPATASGTLLHGSGVLCAAAGEQRRRPISTPTSLPTHGDGSCYLTEHCRAEGDGERKSTVVDKSSLPSSVPCSHWPCAGRGRGEGVARRRSSRGEGAAEETKEQRRSRRSRGAKEMSRGAKEMDRRRKRPISAPTSLPTHGDGSCYFAEGCRMDLAKENKSLKAELEKVRAALAKSESTCLALQKDLAGIDDSYQKRAMDNIPDSNLKSEISGPRHLQLETALEATRKENSELKAQLEEKDMELARVRETATWQDMEMSKLRGMVKELSLPDSAQKMSETDPKALVVANEKIKELENRVTELASAKKRPKFLKFLCISA
ncbi:unnamed protein product [Closterium sp. Yama58-4]|nr:unnamed protein product [Closterium sp. Yama58-4]